MMKKISNLIIVLSFFCSSCDSVYLNDNYIHVEDNINCSSLAIKKYIELRSNDTTRATDNDLIVPYIYKGDTVFYIANYHPGWQILANNDCSPLVLAFSDKGSFSVTDIDSSSPFSSYLSELAEDIYQTRLYTSRNNLDEPIYGDQDSYLNPIYPIMRVDTISVITQDHIIPTKWGNQDPWKSYTRLKNNSHVQVGCGAVAIGQYLYYKHCMDGIPSYAFSKGTINSQTGIYSFSNRSTTIWNKMAINRDTTFTDSTAVFLGYISECVGTSFSVTGTESTETKRLAFLSNQGFDFYSDSIDYTYIINSIQNGEPVLIDAFTQGFTGGHSFICDGYRIENLFIRYIKTNQIISERRQNRYVKMNWGWDGVSDDVWLTASNTSDWIITYTNAYGGNPNQITFPGITSHRRMYIPSH